MYPSTQLLIPSIYILFTDDPSLDSNDSDVEHAASGRQGSNGAMRRNFSDPRVKSHERAERVSAAARAAGSGNPVERTRRCVYVCVFCVCVRATVPHSRLHTAKRIVSVSKIYFKI
jgi:hypothetical protein